MPFNEKYPNLGALIGGTFHQDFYMYGDTLEEIIASYKREAFPNEATRALRDINAYLQEHPDDAELENHFYKTFYPQIVEGAFGTVREFLTKIAEILSRQ